MIKVSDYRVTDHGVSNCQYFQGHGTAFTGWEACATGVGNTYNEAFDDALETLAQADWDTSGIVNEFRDSRGADKTCEEWLGEEPGEDTYYYVSIDVKE